MKVFLSTLFLLVTTSWLMADEADSFAEAREMAAELNKPILIDFWSDN
jgi:hypothetical protein